MYKLSFFVPDPHIELVKSACIKAGAGVNGTYEKCAWQTLGKAQFMPTEKSKPYYGIINETHNTTEYLVEMTIEDELVRPVLEALLEAHPYETPSYGVWKILTIDDF